MLRLLQYWQVHGVRFLERGNGFRVQRAVKIITDQLKFKLAAAGGGKAHFLRQRGVAHIGALGVPVMVGLIIVVAVPEVQGIKKIDNSAVFTNGRAEGLELLALIMAVGEERQVLGLFLRAGGHGHHIEGKAGALAKGGKALYVLGKDLVLVWQQDFIQVAVAAKIDAALSGNGAVVAAGIAEAEPELNGGA